MSVRKERFCDLSVEGKKDILGETEPKPQCNQRAIGRCIFCGRDYCLSHEAGLTVTLGLRGFKEDFGKKLPCCVDCKTYKLPFNPDEPVLVRFEKLWRATVRNIKREKKGRKKQKEK